MFEIGKLYNRRRDIHGRFGGQQQGGISTPSNEPFIFLFTGDSGQEFGYSDHWEDDVYVYVGEGQSGDMKFLRGNKRIRDHRKNGKELLLFKTKGKGKPVEFMGQFVCASWHEGRGPDVDGHDRSIIVFHLIRADEITHFDDEKDNRADAIAQRSIEELRRRAYQAGGEPSQQRTSESSREYYKRSKAVKDYVLARAHGVCELCGKPAPFTRRDGTPYLEPHHTLRLSDSGPDHPRWVASICPNCHREIHSGINGKALNTELMAKLEKLEPEV
jgi:5-methylcytosine-specific restriction protein A